jgi:thiol:disulfide interchange protein DsbD
MPVHALESSEIKTTRNVVTLVSDVDVVEPGKAFHLGLRFLLTPGWHIYWSNPGDAGQPLSMQVELPEGFKASEIQWPTPERMAEGPAMVFGYTKEVTLPITVSVPSLIQAKTINVTVNADWLVCAETCIPEKGTFRLTLPIGDAKPSSQADLFASATARMPRPSPFSATLTNQNLVLSAPSLSPQTVSDAWFFPSAWGIIDHAAPQTMTFNNTGLSLALKPGPLFNPKASLSGVLVLKDSKGQESAYTISTLPNENASAATSQSRIGIILLFALLGGLLLNLMPCVFPILAMKALSIVKLSGAERHIIRHHAIFYTVGVLVAFIILYAITLALLLAGKSIGWGFQFQSPVFVMTISWLFFTLGLNLSGVYSIGSKLMGVGNQHTKHQGFVGSFFTGLLVVVAATPCVAPFMGAAIAAALTAPPIEMLGIFLAMGLGLALPYVLLALFPQSVRFLPRPGRWMEILRQTFAFPMYAASAWLLWVLSYQTGPDGIALALAGLVLIGFAAWLFGAIHTIYVKRIGLSLLVIVLAYLLIALNQVEKPQPSEAQTKTAQVEAYSAARLTSLRAEGKSVFVNMTAAWCITCLVNERMVISTAAVKDAFVRNNITYLKGDWTQQNPEITAFLHEYKHDGVPLYVFYPPGSSSKPVLLPQILTRSILLDTLNTR